MHPAPPEEGRGPADGPDYTELGNAGNDIGNDTGNDQVHQAPDSRLLEEAGRL